MHNVCNVGLPQAIGDIISSIGIGTAAADSIKYRVPAWYRSNPKLDCDFHCNCNITESTDHPRQNTAASGHSQGKTSGNTTRLHLISYTFYEGTIGTTISGPHPDSSIQSFCTVCISAQHSVSGGESQGKMTVIQQHTG